MSAPSRDTGHPIKTSVTKSVVRMFSTAFSEPSEPTIPPGPGSGYLSPSAGGFFLAPNGDKYIQP